MNHPKLSKQLSFAFFQEGFSEQAFNFSEYRFRTKMQMQKVKGKTFFSEQSGKEQ